MTNIVQVPTRLDQRAEIITRAVGILKRGGQVIFPTEHSYAIAVDAFNVRAVAELNELRGAPVGTALSVMIGSPRTLSGISREIPAVGDLLVSAFWPGLLTLVIRPSLGLAWDLGDEGALDSVAVRMPLHPLAIEILKATGPLAVTTAAPTGSPGPLEVESLSSSMFHAVELILDVGPLSPGPTSTIIDLTVEVPRILRQGAYSREVLAAISPDLVLD